MATKQERQNAAANKAYIDTVNKYAHLIEVAAMRLLTTQSKKTDEYFLFRDLTNAINYQLRLPEKDITVDIEAFLRERFKNPPYSEVIDFSANGIRIKPTRISANPQPVPAPAQPVILEPVVQESKLNIRDFSQEEIRKAVDGKRFYAITVEQNGKTQFVAAVAGLVGGTPKLFGRKGNAEDAKNKYAKNPAFAGAKFSIIDVIALD